MSIKGVCTLLSYDGTYKSLRTGWGLINLISETLAESDRGQ
jgi:hypothetical protein